MRISGHLAKADKVCTLIPFLGTVTNLVNIITLTILKIVPHKDTNPYINHLEKKKGYLGCAICMIPFVPLGVFAIVKVLEALTKNSSSAPSIQ